MCQRDVAGVCSRYCTRSCFCGGLFCVFLAQAQGSGIVWCVNACVQLVDIEHMVPVTAFRVPLLNKYLQK